MQDTNTTGESNDTTNTADATREARLNRDGNGDAVGAAVWLNADELADLGVDVDAADAVAYRVEDGDLHVDTVGGSDE
jgi:hypothetical protein